MYADILKDAVYNGKEKETDAGYLTSMTKAMFKDGSAKNAVNFFREGVDKLREAKDKREDLLVSMFDTAFAEEFGEPKNVTYEQFKKRYLSLIQFSERCIKESFAVNSIKRVIYEKSYQEVENLFQFYMLDREETQILSATSAYSLAHN